MAKAKHTPLRSCAACSQKRPKAELLRIVRTPEGRVTVDLVGKEKGRGGYLCPSQECWSLGLTKNRLDYVLRAPWGSRTDRRSKLIVRVVFSQPAREM